MNCPENWMAIFDLVWRIRPEQELAFWGRDNFLAGDGTTQARMGAFFR